MFVFSAKIDPFLYNHSNSDLHNVILVVQLIGARKQAEQFAYRLELNGHRRRLTWEATPRSIHEGVARYENDNDNHFSPKMLIF